MIGDGPGLHLVRADPDEEPIIVDRPRSVYAAWPWLTEEFMRKVESA
ncbi:hypothetical protein OG912_32365 [Streptomyces sp. NBC_00464]